MDSGGPSGRLLSIERGARVPVVTAHNTCDACTTDGKECFRSDPQARCDRCKNLGYQCSLPHSVTNKNNTRLNTGRMKCTQCRYTKQKCLQSDPQAICDRCKKFGYQCSFVQSENEDNIKRRKLSRMKCAQCRHAKQKCLPTFRVWPNKCERCISKGFPCSEPQKAARIEDHQPSASHGAISESLTALGDSETSDSEDALVRRTRRYQHRGQLQSVHTTNRPKYMSFSEVVRRAQTKLSVYSHQPLHDCDMRVLVLHPGSENDPILCHLVPTFLPDYASSVDVQRYTALSYFWGWGTDEPTHEIRILEPTSSKSGASRLAEIAWKIARNQLGKPFYIRPNLFNALHQLRRRERDVILWVDALCINVNDFDERNGQTARMPKIFSRAENVSVWLGNATQSSEMALSFIPKILDLHRFDSLLNDSNAIEEWLSLGELMKNRWFTRRWTLQEVVLARRATLHCGQTSVGWSDFADAVALFNANLGQIKTLCRLSQKYDHDWEFLGDSHNFAASTFVKATSNLVRRSFNGEILSFRYPIATLVSNLFEFEVTNPKDAIYSLLALAQDASTITVDYSHSSRKVLIDFVLSSIEKSGSLDLICRHWAPVGVHLPSWISSVSGAPYGSPSNILKGRINGDSFVGRPGKPLYSSARGRDVAFVRLDTGHADSLVSVVSAAGGLLGVRGFRIDEINRIGARSIQGIIYRESLEMGGLRDQVGDDEEDMEMSGLDDTRNNPIFPEALWRTLVADRDNEGNDPPLWYRRAFRDCLDQRTPQGDIMTNELTRQYGKSRMVTKFLQRVQAVIWNRKFFLTDDDSFFGLAPSEARHGDIVCILFGCSVPVILRECKPQQRKQRKQRMLLSNTFITLEPESTFQFIGECYVYGLMDGEVVKETTELDVEDFLLV